MTKPPGKCWASLRGATCRRRCPSFTMVRTRKWCGKSATVSSRKAAGWVQSMPGQRRDAFDLDQHRRIGQRVHHAGRAGRIRRRPERAGIQRVHRPDVGRPRQQHIDLDEIAQGRAGFLEHALDIAHDKPELRLKAIRNRAVGVKAGNARDEQQVAGSYRERQRGGGGAGGRGEMLEGGQGGGVWQKGSWLVKIVRISWGGLAQRTPPLQEPYAGEKPRITLR